jgi:hypothetical protein
MVDGCLQWLAGAAHLLFEEAGYIVVYGERRPHIMMLSLKAS